MLWGRRLLPAWCKEHSVFDALQADMKPGRSSLKRPVMYTGSFFRFHVKLPELMSLQAKTLNERSRANAKTPYV